MVFKKCVSPLFVFRVDNDVEVLILTTIPSWKRHCCFTEIWAALQKIGESREDENLSIIRDAVCNAGISRVLAD